MPKFEPLDKVISDLCLRSGDLLMRNKGVYRNCASDVWNDLNDDVLRITRRVKIPLRRICGLDKKNNTIDLPCNALNLSSVNVIGENGVFYPIYRNDKLHIDLVDIGNGGNGCCENNCSHRVCNLIKGYEAIQSVKSDHLPDGTPIIFNCVDRKVVLGGILYSEMQYPLRVYLSGVWSNTVLHTEQKKMCDLDVDEQGCACDTERNIESVCGTCSSNLPIGGTASKPPCKEDEAWIYYCNTKMDWFGVQCGGHARGLREHNIYNISELGNKLIFPSHFGFDHVMIRYYEDINLQDLQIPYMAKQCFMTGLQWYASMNNDKKLQIANVYEQRYAKEKWGLMVALNKYRQAEEREILTPRAYMPTYAPVRGYFTGDWNGYNGQ